jgi:hypothetical protein
MSRYASFVLTFVYRSTSYRSILNYSTLLTFTLLAVSASATPTVTVLSPQLNPLGTAVGGPPVFYEAYGASPGCKKGVSAMRIYSAAGVVAYTVKGDHIETSLLSLVEIKRLSFKPGIIVAEWPKLRFRWM